jgi:hypothetical protein
MRLLNKLFKSEDKEPSIVQHFEPDDLSFYDYLEEVEVLFDLPLLWIESRKDRKTFEALIAEKYKIPYQRIIEDAADEGIEAYQGSVQDIIDGDEPCGGIDDSNYLGPCAEKRVDEIILDQYEDDRQTFVTNQKYSEARAKYRSGLFLKVRESDGEYVINGRGCCTAVLGSIFLIVLVRGIYD